MCSVRPRGTDSAKVIQVIKTTSLIGLGEEVTDPCRIVTQYWNFKGELLASNDTTVEENLARDIECKSNKIRELNNFVHELKEEISLLKITLNQCAQNKPDLTAIP